jgi:hypothetical protein
MLDQFLRRRYSGLRCRALGSAWHAARLLDRPNYPRLSIAELIAVARISELEFYWKLRRNISDRDDVLRKIFPYGDSNLFGDARRAIRPVCQNPKRFGEMSPAFRRLGCGYAKAGIIPIHYDIVYDALSYVLRLNCGSHLTDESNDAISEMCRRIAEEMKDAAYGINPIFVL